MSDVKKMMRELLGRPRRPHMVGRVRCEGGCGEKLDYKYGSIAWNVKDRDLCPKCSAKEAVDSIFATHWPDIKESLRRAKGGSDV